ncbi:hypothetical protein QTP86_008796 [Hemibagrus guttatus]|nr:hypothetical protein QTP86_008796 [Hemibagrus guttatus]
MDTLLSVFPSDSTPLTVLGDFNLPSDKLHSSGLLALLNSFSLSFNSCPPTYKEGNVLDLVFTHPSPATDMTVTPLHISDHHLVCFSITLPVLPKRNPQHLSLTRRNLHSISPSSVASCTLSSLPDHESFSSLPLYSATDTLLSSLSSTMDFLCPLSTIRRKNSSPAPWLSDVLRNNRRELRSAARKWKKSKLDTDLTSYRTLLSKFSLDVTSAKTSFYKEKLETSAQDPRKLHNIFSSLLNPPAPPSPSSLTAEDFASFYTEKIERICQTFTSLPTSSTSHNQNSATPSLTQLSTVAAEEVLQITRSCNPTTCPLDPIPSAMLQTISPDLLPFITTVINGSLTSGHVPTAFKKARVIPILKKPALDPSDISNYRPVSLLSFLSKILERVVCNQLSDYLMQNNLHDPNQSGFKAAHSTETALLAVTEKLHAARSAKLSLVLILLHLSAAFDTVNHKTLLSTLRSLGICGTAWEWFASYLDGRSYQVTWKGLTSAPRRLSTGVPQGSVLGPLLFSLYTHSLGKVISSHGFSYHCYADDTQLIFSFPPSDTTASARISACLVDISSWMTAHQLKLNPSKTELLIIPGDPSPAQDLAISLSNSMISPTASARNLGVTMDNQLSFSSHVTNVTRSCRFLLYNIRRIRPFLSTQATQVLVQSLVILRLDYCNSLLAGLPLNAIRPLQMIQNAAAWLVFNLPKFSHTTPLLRSLHWLPVAARIRFKTLMLAYKAKNGPAPSYFKALVTSRTAPRLLRSTSTARLVPPSLREKGLLILLILIFLILILLLLLLIIMDFMLSGVAACGACLFTNPLEVVKTRMQLQGELKSSGTYRVHYRNVFHAFYTIGRVEGVSALQKGLVPGLLYQFFMNGVRLGSYAVTESAGYIHTEGRVSTAKSTAAGAVSGVVGAFVGSPIYLASTRTRSRNHPFRVSLHSHLTLTPPSRTVAVRMRRGLSVLLSNTEFTVKFRERVMCHIESEFVMRHVNFLVHTCTEVMRVKTHLQSQSTSSIAVGHQYQHRGMIHALAVIHREQGIMGLWRGSSAAVPRVSVGSATQLSTFSITKELITDLQAIRMVEPRTLPEKIPVINKR